MIFSLTLWEKPSGYLECLEDSGMRVGSGKFRWCKVDKEDSVWSGAEF